MTRFDSSALHGALGASIFFVLKLYGFGWGISLAALGIYVVLLVSVQRWLMGQSLARYVSPSSVAQRLSSSLSVGDYGRLKEYGILLAQVRGATPEEVSDMEDRACGVIHDHDGMVITIFSGFVLAMFGYAPAGEPTPEPKECRSQTVAVLTEQLGDQIRIVHGVENCIVANWGKRSRVHFGPMLPAVETWLARLLETRYGKAVEK